MEGFGPVCGSDAEVLVLGSMPGVASLAAIEYYAHPRNAFWPIMGTLFDAGPEHPYAERLARLVARRVALWDVVRRCDRPGSLDHRIRGDSVEANDFAGLFATAPRIRALFFNGTAARDLYLRHVLPGLAPRGVEPDRHLLPSTSPANARLDLATKLDRWRVLREVLDASA